MPEATVARCTVDIAARRFTLFSDQGDIKVLDCEDGDQFLRVLEVVRNSLPEEEVVYHAGVVQR